MKVLYANGDSWTFGDEFPNQVPMEQVHRHYSTWPQKLAAMMEIPLVVNESICAGSNHRIFRRTSQFIINWIGKKKCTSDLFVVIGWTTPERTEISIDGRYCRITSNNLLDYDSKKLRQYCRLYYEFYQYQESLLTQIRYMQILRHMCKGMNIKYYDFIGLGSHPNEYNEVSLKNNGLVLDNFYLPNTWQSHIYYNNLPVHRFGHPTEEAHEEWASILLKEL